MNPTGGIPPKVTEDGKEYYKLAGAIDWFLPKLGLEWERSTQFAAVEVKTKVKTKGSIQVNVPIRGTAGFTSGVTHVLVHFKSN